MNWRDILLAIGAVAAAVLAIQGAYAKLFRPLQDDSIIEAITRRKADLKGLLDEMYKTNIQRGVSVESRQEHMQTGLESLRADFHAYRQDFRKYSDEVREMLMALKVQLAEDSATFKGRLAVLESERRHEEK